MASTVKFLRRLTERSAAPSASSRSRATGRPGWLTRSAAIGVALVSVTALAGCGGASDSGDQGGSAPKAQAPSLDPAKKYNLTYWSWTLGSKQAVEAFNASHPNIKVKFEQIPSGASGGYAKITNAFKAGNAPDVFNCEYLQLPSFAAAGQLADLSGSMADAGTTYNKAAMDLVTLGGRTWGVPSDMGVQVMYYRKDLFAKYGLQVPTTWQQFRDASAKLKQQNPKAALTNYRIDDPAMLSGLSWQAGARWFTTEGDTWKVNFNDPATKQVADYWQGMINDGLVAKVATPSDSYAADMAKGNLLTEISGSWNAAYLVDGQPKLSGKWGVAPLPSFDGQPSSGMFGGSSLVSSKNSENQAANAVFAKWMTTDPAAIRARYKAGTSSAYYANPAAADAAKQSFHSDYYAGEDLYGTFGKIAGGMKPWTWGPTMTGTNTVMADQITKLYSGASVQSIIDAGQNDAVKQMKARGLNVTTS